MDYRSIIESRYNRQNWQELLYDIFRQKVQFWQQPQLVPVDESMAKRALFTGKITLPDGHIIAIYEVELSDSVIIERNRAGIRNLLCTNWRGMGCSGAFMFCFRQNEAVLRFSYVSEAFTFTEDGGIKKESTDTKRFTYLLGEGHRSRTAIQQFEKLKASGLTLKDVTKAFSVEALSKMFFDEYKKQYEDIIEFITGKRMVKVANKWEERVTGQPCSEIMQEFAKFEDAEKAVRDYVKKLMGRLVFIQFLQKKGWMGCSAGEAWDDGDREFVQNLFANTQHKNTFVDDVLEPLFNDLNTKRYGDLVTNQNIGRNVKVPYLNGGLFENDDYDSTKFPLPAKYMKSMLDFFASYNFTIDENDPNDAEIGVDPEMLGRIFENLLEDNKDKGAFYTPKEIVQYMCRESLIAYLTTCVLKKQGENHKPENEIRDAVRRLLAEPEAIVPKMSKEHLEDFDRYIREVKICDPAIGSGAFPMGLLNELVRCRVIINAWAKDAYGNILIGDYAALKADIICNNIYGVDIEKGAIDIARLRFWLSIIVNLTMPHALPNFDYKFMQGNSLITTFNGEYVNLDTKNQQHIKVADMKKEKLKLYGFKQQYYSAQGNRKHELTVEIKKSILRLISMQIGYELRSWYNKNIVQTTLSFDGEANNVSFNEIKSQLPQEKQTLVNRAEDLYKKLNDTNVDIAKRALIDINFFDWRIMFTEVFEGDNGGFDIVIGNPPYIKEYTKREAFDGFREMSPYYIGKMDLWYGFACNGIDLLNNSGVLCFIAQNNWTTSAGANIMRNKVITDSRILQLVDFNDYMVFEDASIQTMIMLFCKNNFEDGYLFDFRKLCAGGNKQDMLSMLQNGLCGNYVQLFPIISREAYYNTYLTFSANDNLLRKLVYDKSWLQANELAQGIVFPQDFLNKKGAIVLGHHNVGDGIFGLTKEEKDSLCLSSEEDKLIKPYYTTEEIERYYTNPINHLWMIYTDSSFKNSNSMDSYPTLKNHIDQFLTILTSDNKPYGLHRARNDYFFKGEKIIALRKCVGRPCFSYNDFDCYVTQTFYSIKTDRWNMKFLIGILNSRLIAFWLKHRGKMQGENYQLDKEPLLNIPLPLETCEQRPIISLVNHILVAKKANSLADTTAEEREIDRLVYALYGLTEDEIAIVEGTE